MAVSKYRRFGLRADKNLSDLLDPDRALTHVLDDLVTGTPFTGFDLKVINGLRNTNVSADDLSELQDQVRTYSPIELRNDGYITILEPEPVIPTPPIQSIITDRKTIFGDPPMFKGGTGPYSVVFPGVAVKDDTTLEVFNRTHPDVITDEDYWIEGYFGFATGINPKFQDNFGGIEWEGYLAIPPDQHFILRTNGYFLIEKEYPSQRYKTALTSTWANVNDDMMPILKNSIKNRQVKLAASASATLEITATIENADNPGAITGGTELWGRTMIFVGDIITIGDGSTFEVTNVIVRGLDTLIANPVLNAPGYTVIITLSPVAGSTQTITGSSGATYPITAQKLGQDVREVTVPLDNNWSDGKTKYRVTVWWPNPLDLDPADERKNYPSKYATFDFGDTTGPILAPYNYWYKEEPNYAGEFYSYQYFLNNRLSGKKKRTPTFLQSTKQIFSRYEPTVNLADKIGVASLIWKGKNKFVLSDGFEGRATLEPGDILLFDLETVTQPNGNEVNTAALGSWAQAFGKVYEYDAATGTIWTDPQLDYSDPNTGWDSVIKLGYVFTSVITIASSGLVGLFKLSPNQYDTNTGVNIGRAIPINAEIDTIKYFPVDEYSKPFEIKKQNLVASIYDVFLRTQFQRILTSKPLIEEIAGANTNICDITSTRIGTLTPNYILLVELCCVYNHRGLVDASIDHQCNGVYGKEVKSFPEAAAGQDFIAIDSIDSIQVGDVVQYNPNIQQASLVVANTTNGVQHGTYTDPQGQVWPRIKISKNIATALPTSYTLILIDKDYKTDYTNDGGVSFLDRGFCVLPFNTAPPFLGTSFGLSTSPSYPHLQVLGNLSVTELNIEQANVGVLVDPTTELANRGLEIFSENSDSVRYYMVSR